MCKQCNQIRDGKGHLIGRLVNDILLNGQGKNIARYNSSSDRTLDGKGHVIGSDDQRLKQLKSE